MFSYEKVLLLFSGKNKDFKSFDDLNLNIYSWDRDRDIVNISDNGKLIIYCNNLLLNNDLTEFTDMNDFLFEQNNVKSNGKKILEKTYDILNNISFEKKEDHFLINFRKSLGNFNSINSKLLLNTNNWYNNKSIIYDLYLNKTDIRFPFIQKIKINSDSKCIIFGDLHGDIHTLLRSLLRLHRDGYIDSNWKLRNNVFIFFCGEVIER